VLLNFILDVHAGNLVYLHKILQFEYWYIISCSTPAWICTFLINHVPTLVKNFKIILDASLLTFFGNNYDWWTHTVSPQYANYCLKSEVVIMLHCQLCSMHYQAVQIKNYLKSNCKISMKNLDHSITKGSLHVQPPNWHFYCQQRLMERKGGKSIRMHCAKRHLSD